MPYSVLMLTNCPNELLPELRCHFDGSTKVTIVEGAVAVEESS